VRYMHFFLVPIFATYGIDGTAVMKTHIFHPVKVSNSLLTWFINYGTLKSG
jgi:hypothetical protein